MRPDAFRSLQDVLRRLTHSFTTFGTVYGLAITLSGLLSLFLTPLDILTKRGLRGNYTPVNIGLIIAGAFSNAALAAGVAWASRRGAVRLEGSG